MGLLVLITIIAYMIIMNLATPSKIKGKTGSLTACPTASQNCVSSKGPTRSYIAPLPYIGPDSLNYVESHLKKHYRTRVIEKTKDYLYCVISTRYLRFRDDLEFLVDHKNEQIEVRSASRVGMYDFGVNRERIELLRKSLLSTHSN